MLKDYKKVTDDEKAAVVQLGGLHVVSKIVFVKSRLASK